MGFNATLGVFAGSARDYGEDEVADWVETCSLGAQRRMCLAAEWLMILTMKRGSSTTHLAEAAAAAYVKEGIARPLARKRRRIVPSKPFPNQDRSVASLDLIHDGSYDGVLTEQFKQFWDEATA